MSITIIHTSDFHGKLTKRKASFIKELKEGTNSLYFDCGDLIKTGNLGVPTSEDTGWKLLAEIGVTATVLGNRETHVLRSAFQAKLKGATNPILVANIRDKSGEMTLPVTPMMLVENVGIIGLMVPMVTAEMKTQAASAYLWQQPMEVAKELIPDLRNQCDTLIFLSHLGYRRDLLMAEKFPEIDIILGGHSHTVLEQPERVGKTWISHTGSHGKFVGKYEWDGKTLTGGLIPLPNG